MEWQRLIGLISTLMLRVIICLNYDIFFKEVKNGKKGLIITVSGFFAGFMVASILILTIVG